MDPVNSPSGSDPNFTQLDAASSSIATEPADRTAAPLTEQVAQVAVPRKGDRPSFVFFGVVAAIVLCLDVLSKAWAEIELSKRSFSESSLVLITDHLSFTLAYNKGGAWGLLQDASELIRKPFFFGVSVAAILFIVSLYTRLGPEQRTLKWGLPLVLGGALGNLADRIVRGSVVDFIDYKASWVTMMNQLIAKVVPSWNITDHWPTFNVADVSICIGVGSMALDMIASRRHRAEDSNKPSGDGGVGGSDGMHTESRASQVEGASVVRES